MIDKKLTLSIAPDLYSRNATIAFLLGTFDLPETSTILDVGGHDGRLAWFLDEGKKVIIADQKPQEKPEENLAGEEYIQADARKLPYQDGSFEVVVASDMLEHIPAIDRIKVLEELCRISKNYIILGAPFKKDFLENIENIVSQQFQENAGIKHPFLEEHRSFGLPDQQEVETFLREKGHAFMTIGEGNMANWVLQQLCIGAKNGESETESLTGFNEYFNSHLYELGNYQEPTYRTIFCISKEKTLKSNAILEGIRERNHYSIKTFSYALKIAFGEDRKMLNRRKKQIQQIAAVIREAKEKIVHLRNEQAGLREQNNELYALLQERQQALTLLQAALEEKVAMINNLQAENAAMASEIGNDKTLIRKQDEELKMTEKEKDYLKKHIGKQEHYLKEKNLALDSKEEKILELSKSLSDYRHSLEEIKTSRSWKLIMFYAKIKMSLWTKPARLIKNGWQVLIKLGPKIFLQRLVRKIKRPSEQKQLHGQYQKYLENDVLTVKQIGRILREQDTFQYKPVISIVMPVYNIAEKYLVRAIASVKQQIYQRWELCMCDDASTAPHIRPLLERYAKEDPRIRVIFRKKNGGIVKASNDALTLAQGAYVGLLDNDDELAPNALFEVVKAIQGERSDLIYSDEDKIDMEGNRCEPFFKPDWSPDLLLSINYISHFGVYRRKILNDIGGFREGFDGSQDYDLVLRFTEKTGDIKHIPKILYHWRKIPGSTAEQIQFKPYAMESAKKALRDALKRRKITGEVTDGIWEGSYRVQRALLETPLVSIIIPFKDKKDVLENCLESIFEKTTYPKYEVILVDNQSELFETSEFLRKMSENPLVRVLHYNKPFNYAGINNFAVRNAKGEVLVLLNNDTEIVTPGWIEAMLEHAQRPEVGTVGAKLLYPDNTLQHAGVLIGVSGVANHAFSRHNNFDHGYFGQVDVIRNYSAVTAACMMVRKGVYEKIGGLDEENLAVAFNDVDFCLQLRKEGYFIVYTPYACLYHYESLSRGYDVNMEEVRYIQVKHAGILKAGDPYYNPNLTRERLDFSLRCDDKLEV